MKCPFCGSSKDKVTDTRSTEDDTVVRRRRECLDCGRRFTTYEKLEEMPLMVVKKDGSRQAFDREKLMQSIMKSCAKRPVSRSQIEAIINGVENVAAAGFRREISSQDIGEWVLASLRKVDAVAYVRFASVYRDFDDVDSFLQELANLQGSLDQDPSVTQQEDLLDQDPTESETPSPMCSPKGQER